MKQKIKMLNDQHSQNWLFEEPVEMTCLSAEIHQEKFFIFTPFFLISIRNEKEDIIIDAIDTKAKWSYENFLLIKVKIQMKLKIPREKKIFKIGSNNQKQKYSYNQ